MSTPESPAPITPGLRFLFDNNLSQQLAAGMAGFGENVAHILDLYPAGDPGDEIWLPRVGAEGLFLVTRDTRIRRRPAELQAYRDNGVGGFLLGGKDRGRCDLIRQVVRNWHLMKEKAATTNRPFMFRVPATSGMLERKPL